MNNSFIATRLYHKIDRLLPIRTLATKSKDGVKKSTKAKKPEGPQMPPPPPTATTNLTQLQGILSNMKIRGGDNIYDKVKKFGNSDLFDYATNKRFSQKDLKDQDMETWNRLLKFEIDSCGLKLPMNGFEELISLTEQGKLWRFPIDNEQGLEEEKNVPFEDHIFLDEFLQEFPDNEYIQSFMNLVVSGLAKNHWMTVERKREIIKFYKEYFDERRQAYSERGFEL